MTRGDQRRWAALERIKLQGRLRQLDYESVALKDALGKVRRVGPKAYRDQDAAALRSRLNGVLRERHAAAARLDSCMRELTT